MSLPRQLPILPSLRTGAFAAVLLLSAAPANAQASFESMGGPWLGSGFVRTSDGLHERVRCRANYVAKRSGQAVDLELRCASDAYKFELSSSIFRIGETLSGTWFESTHRVGGKIYGKNTGADRIEVRAEGDTFTALLTVRTTGNRQTFLMESPGAKVSEVSLDLRRSGVGNR